MCCRYACEPQSLTPLLCIAKRTRDNGKCTAPSWSIALIVNDGSRDKDVKSSLQPQSRAMVVDADPDRVTHKHLERKDAMESHGMESNPKSSTRSDWTGSSKHEALMGEDARSTMSEAECFKKLSFALAGEWTRTA